MTDHGSRRYPPLLLAIVLVGLGLRVWYGAEALRIDRFEDEKYSLLNIRSIVTEGTLAPANSFYPYPFFNLPPALLVAGSEMLYRWTEDPLFEAVSQDDFGAAAFLLTRLVQALYGSLALVLVFLIGRRIFSGEVGMIGALILAFMPWHIHASGYFKPDAQLVAMVLLAFYWSLVAVEVPSLKNHLLAGLGIALAMSSKLTGGMVAIPLVVGALASGWRDRRRVALIGVSALVSASLFILLNPYWRYYPVWLGGLERDYAMRAAARGMTRWQIPGRVMGLMTDPYMLGAWLGAVSLAAFAVLVVRSVVARVEGSPTRVQGWMLLSFPVAYTVAYAWKTANFKDNNFLPLIPFFCLLTGWILVGLWRRAEGIWPRLARAPARVLGILVLYLLAMPQGLIYAYRTTTPTTLDRAFLFLGRRMRPPTGRLVLVEEIAVQRPVWEGRKTSRLSGAKIESVGDWQKISEERLGLADATVFRQGHRTPFRTDEPSPERQKAFEPRLFRLRGPSLVAAVHEWQSVGEPVLLPIRRCNPDQRCFAADLPAHPEDAEWSTLVVTLGFARGESVEDVVSIQVGDRQVPLLLASKTHRSAIFVTEKFHPPTGTAAVVFRARKELLRWRQFGIELHRWRREGA